MLLSRLRTTETSGYLKIRFTDGGCAATYGYAKHTELDYGKDCDKQKTMEHELGHVLGLLHEHGRPDRDQYIRVKTMLRWKLL